MLFDLNQNEVFIPRNKRNELDAVLGHLGRQQMLSMMQQLNQWADAIGDARTDFFASNWVTGSDWTNSANGVFQPLYDACEQNFERAGWMFGWLVRLTIIERSDDWLMYKNPEAGTDSVPRNLWGTFYWRRHRN